MTSSSNQSAGDPDELEPSDDDKTQVHHGGRGHDGGREHGGLGRAVLDGVGQTFTPLVSSLRVISAHFVMLGRAIAWIVRPPYRPRNYLEAMEYIGVGSLPIVLLVGAFTGMVTALQSVIAFRQFRDLDQIVGGTTAVALSTELAPVLTALMLAGRVGAGIAAELGTMRITEQIDALESMAVNPIQFLVLPRIVAGILMAPILVMLFFLVGMGGAYLVAVINMGVEYGAFFDNLRRLFFPVHIGHGLIKGAMFGGVIVLIGCFQGFNAKGGGRGVGIGTNRAVVYGSVCVLIFDYFITEILFSVLPPPLAGG